MFQAVLIMTHPLQDYYLQQMGIERWLVRRPAIAPGRQLAQLALQVADCKACELYKTRNHSVFASGNPKASLMIIGEAPGEHEDQVGEVFVGRSGELLNQMLAAIGLSNDDVYLVNVLKCHPENNNQPTQEQIRSCSHFLLKQIDLVQPRWILTLGATAAQTLLNTKEPIQNLRSGHHSYQDTPVHVSYHPAYLLRNPSEKKKVYQDLLDLRGKMLKSN